MNHHFKSETLKQSLKQTNYFHCVSCLIEDNTSLLLYMHLLLCLNICYIQCVHVLICTEVVQSVKLYT